MDDRLDVVLDEDRLQDLSIGDIPQVEARSRRDRPAKAGGKAIEHDDVLACIEQCPDHVTADVAGAACHQNCHVPFPV